MRPLLVALCVVLWPVLVVADDEAPPETRKGPRARFTEPPHAVRLADGKAKITFAVSAPTDVEVAVLGSDGAVVRHLAAGMLGPKAPAPLRKDSLAQALMWDRADNAGRPATGAPFTVRVSIGAKPALDRIVGWDGTDLGSVVGLAVDKVGQVYVLSSDFYRGGTDLRVLDRNGAYRRTIIPYGADTPKERTASVGHLEVEGERLPIVFNGLGRTTHPLTSGMRQQTMVFSPNGHLVLMSALGTMAEHGPPRHLLALHPEGGAPAGVSFVGPRVRRPRGFMGGAGEGSAGCFDHLAVSADAAHVYLSVGAKARLDAKPHAVYRLAWSDAQVGAPWLGRAGEPGSDDDHFDNPQGLAVDAKGNLYVCDYGNSRVVVFSSEGRRLGAFAVEKPQQIAVHPASGDIYVLSVSPLTRWGRLWGDDTVVRKFSPWGRGEPVERARLDARGVSLMALDPSASPARLWLAGRGLRPVTDRESQLEMGASVETTGGMRPPAFIAADPARNRVFVYFYDAKVNVLDLTSGGLSVFCKGTDMALDRQGNLHVMGGRDNAIYRYDPSGAPLAFPALGSNKIMTKGYRGYGPNMGLGGIAVGATGDIYVIRNSNYGGPQSYGGRVDVFGPDGAPKRENLVDGMGYGDCGLGVDAAGNVYIGANVKPKDQPYPEPFMGNLPDRSWTWWRGAEREVPWRYTYYNPYLFHWGAVVKFGPEGGVFYGHHPWNLKNDKYGEPKAADRLENAPPDAVSLRSACLGYEVRMAGAKWLYQGCGIVPSSGDALKPDPGCVCYNSHLAVDPYGRVYAPNVFRFSVEMLDTNGNQIARIGRYGNADSAGPGSRFPEPQIAFVWPAFVSAAAGKVYVADTVSRRIVVVRFDHAAEETCAVK